MFTCSGVRPSTAQAAAWSPVGICEPEWITADSPGLYSTTQFSGSIGAWTR